jgi:hypothetical protein
MVDSSHAHSPEHRMLVGDTEVRARVARVEKLLRIVCGDEEFPYFVSDAATIYDVCSLLEDEIMAKLTHAYHVALDPADLRQPVWKLVDRIDQG